MTSEKETISHDSLPPRVASTLGESPARKSSPISDENEENQRYAPEGVSLTSSERAAQQNPMMQARSDTVGRIATEGDNDEYIRFGHQKYLKSDLYEAFGGTLQPGLAPASEHRFANPAPLGLSAFAATTFTLSLINTKAQGATIPNAIVGPAFFYGGIVQIVAGIWEIALENTFGGTALCSYGGFWMSFAAIYIPWFGVTSAYEGKESELGNVVGFFLLAMTIFTLGITVCTMKSTLMFFLLFFLLGITFLLLAISEFTGKFGVKRSAGVLGIIVSFLAWYNAFAGLATRQNSYLTGHPVPLPTNEYTLAAITRIDRRHGN